MTSPEHHIDGAHVNAPTPPVDVPTSLRPGDEHDWLPGETEADRKARLQQLGVTPEPTRDLGAEWSEQQDGEQRPPVDA